MRKATFALMLVCGAAYSSFSSGQQQAPVATSGNDIFNARCKSCHEPPVDRAPGRAELALRPRADIVAALTRGVMAPMAQGLSESEIASVAQSLAPAPQLGPAGVDKLCALNPPIKATAADWPALGVDANASRFQRSPGLR